MEGKSTVFEIESDVPVPVGDTRRARRKYPFGEMKVGDSFLVPPEGNAQRVRVAAHAWGRAKGQKFSTLTQPCGSMRVWRIE